jgi:arylsulfatase A-like enzyme
MHTPRTPLIALLLLAALAPRAHAAGGPNVLLVTLDTTRADHLGAYGYGPALTPALDALASRGTRFDQAFTSCPMTLPAHATLLTGLEPPEHGLRTNGRGRLDPGVETLATRLAARGYRTGAFVSAFVLDARFGLDRGFATYDDALAGAPTQAVPEPLSVARPGDRVTDAALDWLTRATAGPEPSPFFCWVHLYDPHYPWTVHPELAGTRYEGVASYDADVAFMDRQVGRLVAFLDGHGLREQTLVVAVADHGEGLGDHGEVEHGYLLNDEVLRVPLVVSQPGCVREGRHVSAVVSTVDVLPSVLDLLGLPAEGGVHGRSLGPALRGEPIASVPSYAETDLPATVFGWSPMRSLTTRGWKFVRSTRPELYDRAADPRETHDLTRAAAARARALDATLGTVEAGFQRVAMPAGGVDQDVRRRLAALGYAVGADPVATPSPRKDVKDMLAVKHLDTTLVVGARDGSLDRDAILALARRLVAASPESAPFQQRLGTALLATGEAEAAVEHLDVALRLQPDLVDAHQLLGEALAALDRLPEAIAHDREAVRLAPDDAAAHDRLARALGEDGGLTEAVGEASAACRLRPEEPAFGDDLAAAYAAAGRFADATATAKRAAERARTVGRAQLATEIAARAALYRRAADLAQATPAEPRASRHRGGGAGAASAHRLQQGSAPEPVRGRPAVARQRTPAAHARAARARAVRAPVARAPVARAGGDRARAARARGVRSRRGAARAADDRSAAAASRRGSRTAA